MIQCYVSFIRSILTYGFPCFCNAPGYLIQKFLRVERRIFRIIGVNPDSSISFLHAATRTCTKLFTSIAENVNHPLREMFRPSLCTSTRRSNPLRRPFAKTKRFGDSFTRFCT
jgi:hypothetical protein